MDFSFVNRTVEIPVRAVTFGRGHNHPPTGASMMRRVAVVLAVLLLPSCRTYDYYDKVSNQAGLTPGDQYARYGREQAQAVAIARQLAAERQGAAADERARQLEAAVAFARSQPDVAGVVADSQGNWLAVQFRSGWLT